MRSVIGVCILLVATSLHAQWTTSSGNTTTSDRVGIGTAAPAAKLHVEDLTASTEALVSAGDEPGVPNSATLTIMRKDGSNAQLAKYGIRLDASDSNKFKILYGAGGAFANALLTFDPSNGRAGIGTTSPVARLQVEDLVNPTELIVSAGDEPGVPNPSTLTLMRKDGSDVQAAKYGLRLDAADGNKFKILYGTTSDYSSTPLLTLSPNGNLAVSGEITGVKVFNAVYQDLAEWVPASEDLAPGTVVVLNRDRTNEVTRSSSAYDSGVAGVVSAQPGVVLGVGGASKEMIATTGRVKVRVDARQAAISVGDLLVTSDVAGTAMKSQPMDINGRRFHQPGTIIGKALEPLSGGTGEILVLLSLQ